MIKSIHHLVLTTTDEAACVAFYVDLLGMRLKCFGNGRKALRFGTQKINIHVEGRESEPKAHLPVPGALELCFLADRPLDEVTACLATSGVSIIEGLVERTSPTEPMRSIYLRDPDLNLIEIYRSANP